MKSIVLALLALLLTPPISARAASPLENYLAARDAYIKKFTALDESGKYDKRANSDVQRALGDLEKRLRGIVGPVAIPGFSAAGKINADTLVRSDIGFGSLDALVYTSQSGAKDKKSRVYVTTTALFDQWLKDHPDNWALAKSEVPKDMREALTLQTFYTFAISGDAAVDKYAELPVAKPAKAKSAFAMLAGISQDDAPIIPGEIIVSVLDEASVFIATAPVAAKLDPIPACQDVWSKAEQAAEATREANPGDDPTFELWMQLRDEGVAAFHRCYAERAKGQPTFAAVVRQAQALLERLPLK